MIAKVYNKPDGQIELIDLARNAKELDFLSKQLLIDNTVVNLERHDTDSFAGYENLSSIRVKHLSNRPVKIDVEDDSLVIEGSPDKLKVLSENLEKQGTELKNYHIHIEYFDGHFYLSSDSQPLVVNFI